MSCQLRISCGCAQHGCNDSLCSFPLPPLLQAAPPTSRAPCTLAAPRSTRRPATPPCCRQVALLLLHAGFRGAGCAADNNRKVRGRSEPLASSASWNVSMFLAPNFSLHCRATSGWTRLCGRTAHLAFLMLRILTLYASYLALMTGPHWAGHGCVAGGHAWLRAGHPCPHPAVVSWAQLQASLQSFDFCSSCHALEHPCPHPPLVPGSQLQASQWQIGTLSCICLGVCFLCRAQMPAAGLQSASCPRQRSQLHPLAIKPGRQRNQLHSLTVLSLSFS